MRVFRITAKRPSQSGQWQRPHRGRCHPLARQLSGFERISSMLPRGSQKNSAGVARFLPRLRRRDESRRGKLRACATSCQPWFVVRCCVVRFCESSFLAWRGHLSHSCIHDRKRGVLFRESAGVLGASNPYGDWVYLFFQSWNRVGGSRRFCHCFGKRSCWWVVERVEGIWVRFLILCIWGMRR